MSFKCVQLTTPSSSSDILDTSGININKNTEIVGFSVNVYSQWRSGQQAGTLCLSSNDGTVYYINTDSSFLNKPIRIWYR